ncbi:MAG: GAF domain-containing protein [Tenacibaculum sp.]|nr:GAF domain-containing protein [Tenacibaculum sp.]
MKKHEKTLLEVSSILDKISTILDVERSTLFLLNEQKETLDSMVAQGVENIVISVPKNTGLVWDSFNKADVVIENNVQTNSHFNNSFDNQLQFVTKSVLCVPVFDDKEQVIGVLQCLNKRNGTFSNKDVRILNSFAAAINLIVKNSELYYASEHLKNNFSSLLEVFKVVSSELNLNKLIPLIMNKAAEITNADRSSLFLVDEETNELWTIFAKGLENNVVRTKKGIVANVARNKKPLIVNDPYSHPDFNPLVDKKTGYTTRSILSVPVFNSENEVLGVVQSINKHKGEFNQEDLDILTGFASQIKIAIENAKLFDQIQGMKNYLNILVQNLDSGIITIDNSLKVKTANDQFYNIFGLNDGSEFIENNINDIHFLGTKFEELCLETLQSGKKLYHENVELKLSEEKLLTLNISVLPMKDVKDNNVGVIIVFNDISKEKRIQSNLSRYIPQHLVNEVMNRDNLSLLKGKYSKCSILFSDIRNFTTLTEKFGAIEIVKLLNNYFEAMISLVYKYDGILDKFIGDAIMSVFGIPYANISDSKNAVYCALEMLESLRGLNERNELSPNINIGLGISTGNVVSGNIGSEKRFEYTVIGDSVNLAARLESATKIYDIDLLICEETYNEIKDEFYCRQIDTIFVKGKQFPVNIFTVTKSRKEDLTFEEQEFYKFFSSGLSLYKQEKYKEAKKSFVAAKDLNNADGPTTFFIEKCEQSLLIQLPN